MNIRLLIISLSLPFLSFSVVKSFNPTFFTNPNELLEVKYSHAALSAGIKEASEKVTTCERISSANRRVLNPKPLASPNETLADKHFRIAFSAATGADFSTAIINYERAALMTCSECDRKHALAGIEAAQHAQQVGIERGTTDKLTQRFWLGLQHLTKGLPCVRVR